MVKKKVVNTGNACITNCSPQCIGMKLLILGILVLLNHWFAWFLWPTFIGLLMVVWGIIMVSMKKCPCTN